MVDVEKQVAHWRKGADEAWEAAQDWESTIHTEKSCRKSMNSTWKAAILIYTCLRRRLKRPAAICSGQKELLNG